MKQFYHRLEQSFFHNKAWIQKKLQPLIREIQIFSLRPEVELEVEKVLYIHIHVHLKFLQKPDMNIVW